MRARAQKLVKLGVVLFGLLLAGLAVAAWVGGERSDLPFEYEGFD